MPQPEEPVPAPAPPRRAHGPRPFRRSQLLPYRAEFVHQRRAGASLAVLQRWLRQHRVRVARSTIKRYLDQLPELHAAQLSPPRPLRPAKPSSPCWPWASRAIRNGPRPDPLRRDGAQL
jgi:hypothetical protein